MSRGQLHIRVLGPLEVLRDESLLELPASKKARALLAYLVSTERHHSRSSLCDLFWQNVNDPRAGLRWALSKLRAVVDDGECRRLVTSKDRVGFLGEGVEVDLHRVRSLVPADPDAGSIEAVAAAGRAFRGEFLEGLDLPACHGFQAWCFGTRERLRTLHVSIHRSLAERLGGDPEAALSHALTRLSLDPYSEDAYVRAIEVLGSLGRQDQGLELYERCRHMLSKHLGAHPTPRLDAARRGLRSPQRPFRSVDAALPDAGASSEELCALLAELPEPEGLAVIAGDEPPLVGRDDERRSLSRILASVRSDGTRSVVLVAGEPGIGKTRLLRELAGEVRSSGGWVLGGRVFETEEIRPYGPWIDLLRQAPAAFLDAAWAEGLSGLFPGPGSDPRPGGPTERAQLFDAAAELLKRMAEARAPGLVILDDLQWLDSSSAALLHYLIRTLGAAPLTFALAAREEAVGEGSPAARLLGSLGDTEPMHRIPLRRLDASETGRLVRAVDGALDAAPVFEASEGNPLFTLAVARSLRDGIDRTPTTIEEEMHDRLSRLDPGALSLLPWAAALGRGVDLPTLVRVVNRPTHEIVESVDSLERRGILRTSGADRYDFTHSLLRRAAYRRLSKPARRQVHRSIAQALDALERSESHEPGAVAHHAELGGLPRLAALAYTQAAEHSLWLFAFDEAVALVDRGLAQAGGLPDQERIPLEMGLLRIYSFRSMRERRPGGTEARVHRLVEEARVAGFTEEVATGHALLMELQFQRGAFEEAGQSSVRYADAGREGHPVTAMRALAETAACLLLLDQAPDDARRLALESFALAEARRENADVVALARALLHHHEGKLGPAAEAFQEVIRLGRQAQDRWWEWPAMTRLIMVDLDRGDPKAALARAEDAEELAERMEDESEAAFARGLGAVAAAMGGRPTLDRDLGDPRSVDDALAELRELDSLWKIGHVQAYAAEVELERGRPDAARHRLEEALDAARTLKRPSLTALVRGLLARCAAQEGRPSEADEHLGSPEITRPHHRLSARARGAVLRARKMVS